MAWQTLHVRTTARVQLVDITDLVAGALEPAADGLAVLVVPHTTAALLLNEPEAGLLADIEGWLARLAPQSEPYAHNRVDHNADAHLRAIALGPALTLPVEAGTLALGTWQRIFFVELDGPRRRQVRLRVVD